jgi:hypothetical protein
MSWIASNAGQIAISRRREDNQLCVLVNRIWLGFKALRVIPTSKQMMMFGCCYE